MSKSKEAIVQQQAAEQLTTRSDIATTTRSVQDLRYQIDRLQNNLHFQITQSPQMDLNNFENIWGQREQLNSLNSQLNELEKGLASHIPSSSNARLTEKERREIRGLHSSGLYTQKQLADQYGVTQPTISDVVKQS